MQQHTSLKIRLDDAAFAEKDVLTYLNGYCQLSERREEDRIYLPDYNNKKFKTIKLRSNDSFADEDGVNTIIYEIPLANNATFFRNAQTKVDFNVSDEFFNNYREMLGAPDCVLFRNRKLFSRAASPGLTIYLDSKIQLMQPNKAAFKPANAFLEFKMPYTNQTIKETQAHMWDLAERMHFTVGEMEKRSYYEMMPK